MSQEKSIQILSDITHFMKYAKYMDHLKRRETFAETTDRNKNMHLKKFPDLSEEIERAYSFVHGKKILPSMRSMQFAGKPVELNNSRIFNCSYLPVDHIDAFSEIMFLLLSGCGVGFSVQRHHVAALPPVKGPRINPNTRKPRKRRYVIGDSIEGWADAVKVLVEAYFYEKSDPEFVFDGIREKGARLMTSGGKAPGPQPLKDCIHNMRKVLDSKGHGEVLSTVEVHDIVCYIADAVLAGGIRRAALISLFSFDDENMRTAKFGSWWEDNPQRARANNSAVALRHRIKKGDFLELWDKIQNSNSGEPGIYFSNNQDWGANPCVEIGLRPFQFCNLVEINGSLPYKNQKEFNEVCRAATLIATLQASYTEFHYLREVWQETTEKDALIGVSITGIASGRLDNFDLTEAANSVIEENKRVAELININPAARTTCVKPAGTTSCILGTSSGIHAWHNDWFIRRIRVGKNEPIYRYLAENHSDLVEDDYFKPHIQAIISLPIRAPKNSVLRTETVMDFLSRVKRFSEEWVLAGHVSGQNAHNVSATVAIKPDEWGKVADWMWKNRSSFNGLAVLPHDGGSYIQAPFEDCSEYMYKKLYTKLEEVDLTKIKEEVDNTDQKGEIACGGGACELT
jgi:ribonucleoside-triphosphate reductase (thioredoxin)